MKSYGCSFGHTVSLDRLVLETLLTQRAVSAFFAAYATQLRKESYSWTISRFCRNKMAHSLHGNTFSRKGMGKGKKGAGKDTFIDEEELFRQEIKSALPGQAILRMQPVLFESDWNVPTRTSFELSSSPGIAIVMKSQVPNVLRQVGYTQNSVAMITTQSSSQLHLRGYPSQELYIRIQIKDESGDSKELLVRRWLTQLGFGKPVEPTGIGEQVNIPECMTKIVIKFASFCGWLPESLKGSTGTVMNLLTQHVNENALESLQIREPNSATLLAHDSVVPQLLQSSGKDGLFVKVHASAESKFPLEIYWLPQEFGYQDSLALAEHGSAMGLIAKKVVSTHHDLQSGSILLKTLTESFTKEKELPTYINTSRWRLEGVSPTIGSAGIIQFLETKGWSIHELLYCGERHAVYTATKMGSVGPMYYRHPGSTSQQLRFKALNSLARKEQAAASQAERSKTTASTAAVSSSSQKRTAFLRTLTSHTALQASPKREAASRPPPGNTGQTPPPKQQRVDGDRGS